MRLMPEMPNPPELGPADVYVWRALLAPGAVSPHAVKQTLSTDERARADRLHGATDRKRFLAVRGLLRALLGGYLQRPPHELRFHYTPRGRPALAPPFEGSGLRFSISHSCDFALFAVARGREVGVDIERVRADVDIEKITRRFFSPREIEALRALPQDRRVEAFFRAWTSKEACIKARGEGVPGALRRYEVSIAPDEPARLLHVHGDAGEAARWSLFPLEPASGYAGALAVAGRNVRLIFRE